MSWRSLGICGAALLLTGLLGQFAPWWGRMAGTVIVSDEQAAKLHGGGTGCDWYHLTNNGCGVGCPTHITYESNKLDGGTNIFAAEPQSNDCVSGGGCATWINFGIVNDNCIDEGA
ncbi:MAG TPA: hypothetical protein VFA18_19210 [Gemmataceae bacterium]|nr:hypothetical protein [Gemmataceae bacterium]